MNLFTDAKRLAKILETNYNINYSTCKVDILADGYCDACDAGDEYKKNLFISGLILRFWFAVKKMQDNSPGVLVSQDEFVSWLYEAIEYACKYRKWRTTKVNAQQCINQCIATIRKQHYYEFNLDKHKANYNTVSIDQAIGEQGNSQSLTTLGDTLADKGAEDYTSCNDGASVARELIQHYIDAKKIVDAIILDTIAFDDTQKVHSETVIVKDENDEDCKCTRKSYEFWQFKCIQALNNLPESYTEYFYKYYDVKPAEFEAALKRIQTANNQTLYKLLRATLASAQKSMR